MLTAARHATRFAIIGNQAFSLVNFRAALMEDILARGHEVYALAPDLDSESRKLLEKIGVTPVEIPLARTGLNPIRDAIDLIQLWRILSSLHLDNLLGFAIKPVIYGTLVATLVRVPGRYALIAGLGYAFSGGVSFRDRVIHIMARTLYKLALARTRIIFMQNPDDADDFVRMGIVPRSKIVPVSGTGVDLIDWRYSPPPCGLTTFVLAARLLAEKGIREYIAAARKLRAMRSDVRFVLLGGIDSNPLAISKNEVERWVEEGIVEWPGHVEVKPWLEQSSVYVLPSYYREGVPRSIQEAMATGRPIITTDSPGCRETVVDGDNGFLVPPRDVDSLVAAMLHFIDNPQKIGQMGLRSRELAEERFDVRKINAKMIAAMGL